MVHPTTHDDTSIQSSSSHATRSSTQEAPLSQEEIEKKPWKHIGYRGYADFLASENDFFIVRRFAALNTRVALALQDQVTVLEEKLSNLDREYSRRDAEDRHNGSFRDDFEERIALVEAIGEKLMKYSA